MHMPVYKLLETIHSRDSLIEEFEEQIFAPANKTLALLIS